MTDHSPATSAPTPAQHTGFTGVDWASRPAEQLRAELFAGPGPVPAGELGAAWAGAAIELDACAAELRAVLVLLESDVVMAASPMLAEHGRRLADWLESAAGEARTLSEWALTHAAATTRARAAMPSAAEFDAAREVLSTLSQLGPGIAGLLGGAHHALEQSQQDAERTAAAVMGLYEQQTAPLVGAQHELAAAPRLTLPELPAPAATADAQPSATAVEGQAAVAAAAAPAPARPVSAPARPATRATAPRPSYAHVVERASSQVRPAALAGPAVPATAPSGHATTPSLMTTGLATPTTAHQAAPVAPIGPAAPVHRGPADAAPAGPAAAVQAAPARASELYGLAVAVAPPVIGGAQPGEGS